MSGLELRDGTLIVRREPNHLDELAIEFSEIPDRLSIDHIYIARYVSILAGRARSTEDIDVLIEDIDEDTAKDLSETLKEEGFRGAAMPLTSMYEMLSNGDNIWVAPEDQVIPHLEVKFARDEFDRASLKNSITARIGGRDRSDRSVGTTDRLQTSSRRTEGHRRCSPPPHSSRKALVSPAPKSG